MTTLFAAAAALTGHRADVILAAAAIGVIVGGLLCLAGGDDEPTGAPARGLLGLAAGGGLALGLAHGFAAVLLRCSAAPERRATTITRTGRTPTMGNVQTQINKLFTDLAALGTGVIVGGIMWVFSAGSQRRVEHARTTILAGVGGLIVVLLANTIAVGVRGVFGG
jgi:hypothetical protein